LQAKTGGSIKAQALRPLARLAGSDSLSSFHLAVQTFTISCMAKKALKSVLPTEPFQVFVCYAHADNENANPEKRWLNRLLEFIHPLERQGSISCWSDRKLEIGDQWHENIQARLDRSKAVILLISPAFLSSQYVSTNELPLILSNAIAKGLLVIPILLSPSLFDEVEYKYPNEESGPHKLRLSKFQPANPPSKTLVEMNEGEQKRVFLGVARRLSIVLPSDASEDSATSVVTTDAGQPLLLAQFQEEDGELVESGAGKLTSFGITMWVENAPRKTTSVSFEIDDLSFKDRIWTLERTKSVREFLTDDMDSWGNVDIWVRGNLADGDTWLIRSSLYEALKRFYGSVTQELPIKRALKQIRDY
jgi:hypothetical protein